MARSFAKPLAPYLKELAEGAPRLLIDQIHHNGV